MSSPKPIADAELPVSAEQVGSVRAMVEHLLSSSDGSHVPDCVRQALTALADEIQQTRQMIGVKITRRKL